ncbi:MAG: DUF4124 domain-containing protein [Pseudomonadota bacterium]
MTERCSTQLLRGLLATTLVAAVSMPAAAQKLYKWVDADGNVYYSDQVPPAQVKRGREELNDQGVVIDKVDRAKTPQELAEEAKLLAEKQAMEEAEEARLREERKLKSQYNSEDDIIAMRDQRIDAMNRQIQSAQTVIDSHTGSLEGLTKRASEQESQGLEVSDDLRATIALLQEQIAQQEQKIMDREAEKLLLKAEFDEELARFRRVMQGRGGNG